MNRWLPTLGTLVVAVLLQVAVAPHVAIGGVVPNLLLLVVLTFALIEGRNAGAIAGFSAGLLFDLLGTGPVGVAALVFAVTGYFAGSLSENMFAEGWLLPATVVFVAGFVAEFSYAVALVLLGAGVPLGDMFLNVVLPAALYNETLALLVYPVVARFLRRDREMTTFGRIG